LWVLPNLSAIVKELNPFIAQRIINVIAKQSFKNLGENSSRVMKYLSKYFPDVIRNKWYLDQDNKDILAKCIYDTKETLAEPDISM
jgi:hypothetical protein